MPCSKLHAVEVLYSGKSNQCKGEDDGDTENTVRGDDQSIVLKSRGRGRTSSLRNNGHAHYCCASEHVVGEKTKRC